MNEALIKEGRVPGLYQSGVRYVADEKSEDIFADALHTFRAGKGDCSSLVAWRVGELWASGEPVDFWLHWRTFDDDGRPVLHSIGDDAQRVYHIKIRRADGSVEDPSRMLGMPT